MIGKCISSSKFLSSIDSVRAHDICGCATNKLIENYSYDEIWELNRQKQDSLIDLFTPVIEECAFPILYEKKYTIINDTSQLKWINDSIISIWTPNFKDYRIAESILDSALIDHKNEYWSRLDIKTSKDYYRQYVFYKNSQGDLMVYINAFCEIFQLPVDSSGIWIRKPYDWKKNLLIVQDGGDCYWTIKINLTKKMYFDFYVNGEA